MHKSDRPRSSSTARSGEIRANAPAAEMWNPALNPQPPVECLDTTSATRPIDVVAASETRPSRGANTNSMSLSSIAMSTAGAATLRTSPAPHSSWTRADRLTVGNTPVSTTAPGKVYATAMAFGPTRTVPPTDPPTSPSAVRSIVSVRSSTLMPSNPSESCHTAADRPLTRKPSESRSISTSMSSIMMVAISGGGSTATANASIRSASDIGSGVLGSDRPSPLPSASTAVIGAPLDRAVRRNRLTTDVDSATSGRGTRAHVRASTETPQVVTHESSTRGDPPERPLAARERVPVTPPPWRPPSEATSAFTG